MDAVTFSGAFPCPHISKKKVPPGFIDWNMFSNIEIRVIGSLKIQWNAALEVLYDGLSFSTPQGALRTVGDRDGPFRQSANFGNFHSRGLDTESRNGPGVHRRIVRSLGALDIFEEVGEGIFKQTALSQEWNSKFMQSYTRHSWDNVFRPMSSYIDFFNTTGFVCPSDRMNTPFAFSKGAKDIDFFNLLQQDPKAGTTFNEAMTSFKDPLGDLYDFSSLQAGKDGVVLVDIGGGKDQSIQSICSAYPDLKADTSSRISQPSLKRVIGYVSLRLRYSHTTSLNRSSPSKALLHIPSSSYCMTGKTLNAETILRKLAPATRGYKSKLLICDIVLSDSRPDPQKVLYDINMFFMAGKERSVKQWHGLMEGTGFRIERIVGLDNPVRSVIEVVLDE